MIRTALRTAPLLALTAMGGCASEEPAGPAPAAQGAWIEVSLQAGGQSVRLPITTGGVVVESASFWIKELRLVGDQGGEEDRLRIRGRTLDLGPGGAVFRLPDAPPGLYSRVRLDLEGSDDDDDDDNRTQPSLSITGKAADGQPFSIRDGGGVELDLRAGDGVELVPGKDLTASVRLNLDGWFAGVQLASRSGDRESSTERLRDNIERSGTLSMRMGAPATSAPSLPAQ